jgi:hypothetical protein
MKPRQSVQNCSLGSAMHWKGRAAFDALDDAVMGIRAGSVELKIPKIRKGSCLLPVSREHRRTLKERRSQ